MIKPQRFRIVCWCTVSALALLLGIGDREYQATSEPKTNVSPQGCHDEAMLHSSHPDVQALKRMRSNSKLIDIGDLDVCLTQKDFVRKLAHFETETGYFFETGYCVLSTDKPILKYLQKKYEAELDPYVKLQQEYKAYLSSRKPETGSVTRTATSLEQVFSVTTRLTPHPPMPHCKLKEDYELGE